MPRKGIRWGAAGVEMPHKGIRWGAAGLWEYHKRESAGERRGSGNTAGEQSWGWENNYLCGGEH